MVAVLEEAAPKLIITKEQGHVIICWNKTCRCYKLQATRSLNPRILWVDVPDEPVDLGDRFCLSLPISGRMRFFRLIRCDQPVGTVYEVSGGGITPEEGARLAAALKIPGDQLSFRDGGALFLDPKKFQAIPMLPIQDPAIIEELARGSENDKRQLHFEAIDFDRLARLQPLGGDDAIGLFERALREAD